MSVPRRTRRRIVGKFEQFIYEARLKSLRQLKREIRLMQLEMNRNR